MENTATLLMVVIFSVGIMMLSVVPIIIFLGLYTETKMMARDIHSIALFLENPPPLEMRTSLSGEMHNHIPDRVKAPYTNENYL